MRAVAAPSTGSLHSACPFGRGLLSRSHGSKLVDIFRTKLVPHFPFVVVPTDVTEERPLLHLAVLSAASFDDVSLQRRLGALFSDVVAKRLASGPFATLDMLEALLVHCAWCVSRALETDTRLTLQDALPTQTEKLFPVPFPCREHRHRFAHGPPEEPAALERGDGRPARQ